MSVESYNPKTLAEKLGTGRQLPILKIQASHAYLVIKIYSVSIK